MAEAKHSFVDDNPYIVYSPNAETTSEGGSGGGGAGFPVIEEDPETGALSVTAGALKTMLDTSPVIMHFSQGINPNILWVMFIMYAINDSKYHFMATTTIPGSETIGLAVWEADTASDYPIPSQG